MDGILVVDKPSGPTSFDVVRRLKALGTGRKAGHVGTLDPLATGVLPVVLGDATKIAAFVGEGEKVYEGVVRLGVETDSYDAQGKVVATRDASALRIPDVERAVASFAGEQWQTPPMFSAAKVAGKRLYELARRGEEVERKPRKIRVHEIALLRFDAEKAEASIRVRCTKGTYIRTIAHELGRTLGVGGHLTALRRTRNGLFGIEQAVPLAVVLDLAGSGRAHELARRLVSLRDALADLPEVVVDEARARKVVHGMTLGAKDLAEVRAPALPEGTKLRLVGPDGRLLAVGEAQDGAVRYARVLVGPGAA